ncbi:MAG: HPF/RaiA family ribosome-associated protein [Saprospiraceae bacterium]|nr:HPF/RaiA family ribosome-associated protein [Saprospiraceae bacterium]MDW8228919.1 HPF/RaiA family ribosome-associated protein [Saprospiraceae bacterium]
MVINIQSIRFKADDHLQAYVQEKVGKLFSVNDKILRADVKISEQSGVNRYQCEIRLAVPGNHLIAKRSAETHKKAVYNAVSTLSRRLRDQKKR